MSSPEARLAAARGEVLLAVAHGSVEHGLHTGRPLEVEPGDYDPSLRDPRATFVTLRIEGKLRGCTGSLEAVNPLVVDVARSAHRSAFEDPRFPAVDADEIPRLAFHVSVLSPLDPLPAESEAALRASLRPGIDGLVLREGPRSGTFLPSVWDSLPSPERFLQELKRKAGLPLDYWSPTLRFERYTVEEFD
jgi:AmmeMemoRadiSam system protein A